MISPFVLQALVIADQADRRRDEASRERLARIGQAPAPRFAGLRRLVSRMTGGGWPAPAVVRTVRDDPYPGAGH
jgi:hypothetical protein